MDIYTATEQAYKNGYEKGLKDGQKTGGCWTEISTGVGLFDYCFVCLECGYNTPRRAFAVAPDFCPGCGTKMNGEHKGCQKEKLFVTL